MLRTAADVHTAWSLEHGDDVAYVPEDAGADPTDLSLWQADRSAPADIQDELNAKLYRLAFPDAPDPVAPVVASAEFERLHPRIPADMPGGGRFRSIAARVVEAFATWDNGGRNGDPFHGFTRVQLRNAATHRGMQLRRGATRDEIGRLLEADLHANRDRSGGRHRADSHRSPDADTAPGRADAADRPAVRDLSVGDQILVSEARHGEWYPAQAARFGQPMTVSLVGTPHGYIPQDRVEIHGRLADGREVMLLQDSRHRSADYGIHPSRQVMRVSQAAPPPGRRPYGNTLPENSAILRGQGWDTGLSDFDRAMQLPGAPTPSASGGGGRPNVAEVRAQMLGATSQEDAYAYLVSLNLNTTQSRRLAADLGVRGAGRMRDYEVRDRIVDDLVGYRGVPRSAPAPAPQPPVRRTPSGRIPASSIELTDWTSKPGHGPMSSRQGSVSMSVRYEGTDVGDIHRSGPRGVWTAFPPTDSTWGLGDTPGSGMNFATRTGAARALANAHVASLSAPTTAPAPATSESIGPFGIPLSSMATMDLRDLAAEHQMPGYLDADRPALIAHITAAQAGERANPAARSQRPTVGLRMSIALNDWANGNGPDDPLAGFSRPQLRQAAAERGITLRRGATEESIRNSLYDSMRSSVRGRRASLSGQPSAGDLFTTRDPAMREMMAKAVFEGDFGGLSTKVDSVDGRGNYVSVGGSVYDSRGHNVGRFTRQIQKDPTTGDLTVYHAFLQINGTTQGNGFSNAFNGHLINWYRQSGVKQVTVHANIDVGGYTWASFGYDFATRSDARMMEGRFRDALRDLEAGSYHGRRIQGAGMDRDHQIAELKALMQRIDDYSFGQPGYPTARDFSQTGKWQGAGGRSDVWIGKALMLGMSWHGVYRLQ